MPFESRIKIIADNLWLKQDIDFYEYSKKRTINYAKELFLNENLESPIGRKIKCCIWNSLNYQRYLFLKKLEKH